MIPPCDPAILKNNPDFQRLHEHLTKSLLNPDGTSNGTHIMIGGQSKDSSSDLEDVRICRYLFINR
jgi:diphthamide biosynthesis protein 3